VPGRSADRGSGPCRRCAEEVPHTSSAGHFGFLEGSRASDEQVSWLVAHQSHGPEEEIHETGTHTRATKPLRSSALKVAADPARV
jgi:hypothetical protein